MSSSKYADLADLFPASNGDGTATGDPETGRRDTTIAMQLVELAEARYELGRSLDGTAHAVDKHGPAVALPLRGAGGLRASLADAYMTVYGRVPSSASLTDALAVLEGRAQRTDRRPVHLRVARHCDDRLVDMGDEAGHVIAIGPDHPGGWQLLDRSPVLWRRSRLTGELPEPTRGGDLELLRRHIRVSDDTWPVLVGWLVAGLDPDIPHPVMPLTGPQGAGKSTTARRLVDLLDPGPAPLRTSPRSVEDWAVAAAGSWFVALDNVSTIPEWLSDALCRAVTGDGMVRRALYTDNELAVLAFRRVVIITSIDPGALRGDLAERLAPVEVRRIPDRERLDEDAMEAAWAADRPAILGGLLDLAGEVYRRLPNVRPDRLPRMADFGRLLAALDDVTGWDALDKYLDLSGQVMVAAVDDDPVASAVRDLVQRVGTWTGTAAELLEATTPDPVPRGWPSSPRGLSGRLRRAEEPLRSVGIEVEYGRQAGTGRRIISLSRTE